LNIVEWKKKYNGGVHGVYNPSTGIIEWRKDMFYGNGGVYNPLKREVEWKSCYKGDVVGYFDYETQTIKWTQNEHYGIALISWDPYAKTYLTTSSCGWYDND